MDTIEWGYVTALWMLSPAVQAGVYVTILGCLSHPHKLQGGAAIVTLLLAARQAVVRPNPDAYAAVGVAVAALVVAASFDAVRGPSESLADSVHILFDETEDVDEAEPRART